jgi:F-type H+-transporting ATPase subunit b
MRPALLPDCAAAACETPRKLLRWACIFALALWIIGSPARLAAQPEPGHATATAEEHGEEPHEDSLVSVIARFVNFAVLAGSLVYFLRSPLAGYLSGRSAQIRSDLVNAAEMKQAAAAQIEEIDRKMKALPADLEALRKQGVEEIAAEETRIQAAATAERERLLEQARREIDLQVKVAERELVSHAADLAVGVATERIKTNINADDQQRLVDRYVQQLGSPAK